MDPGSLPLHVDRMYRAAWAMCGSREDAEDLVQETFAAVLSRPRVIRDERAYLMRALRNTYRDWLRTASRRPVVAAELDHDLAPDPRSTADPSAAMAAAEVLGAIAELPDDFRLAVIAVDILGLSYREAAIALRTREKTIATRVFRGRDAVADRLLPREDAT